MEQDKTALLNEILTRSISNILPSKEELVKVLRSDKKLRIYVGADATGPQLHLGHATNFMLLEKLRRLGHEIFVLFGDFTAMIGDPTDKSAARVRLTKEQVEKNIASWRSQVEKILSFTDANNPAKIVRNSEWLAKLNFADVMDLASNFTVQQMLERDMFEKRMTEHKPIYVHEFFYPLMQGYDSVHLDVDIEIGGTDQTFNMLVGRTLQKKYNNREKFVIATTLLENPKTGKKLMSKSEGGYIALNDAPQEMFGKTMALPDEVIIPVFIDCTYLSLEEIRGIESSVKSGSMNPKDAKVRLAKELVTIYHSVADADAAEVHFARVHGAGEMPEEIKEVKIEGEMTLVDALVTTELVASKTDARRQIEQKGVKVNGEVVEDGAVTVKAGDVIQKGKRFFVKLV